MSETPSTRRWWAVVQAHAASGLSNADFAKAHNLKPSMLAWWRTRLKKSPAVPAQGEPHSAFPELVVAERAGTVVLTLDVPDLRHSEAAPRRPREEGQGVHALAAVAHGAPSCL